MTASSSRWYDRGFAGTYVHAALGPIASPSVDEVRRVVAQTVRAAPDGPAAASVRGGSARRRTSVDPEALARRLVQPAPPLEAEGRGVDAELADRCARDAAPQDDLPFRLGVGPDSVTLAWCHVLGDAGIANGALSGIVAAALGGALPAPLIEPTSAGVTRAALRSVVTSTRELPRANAVPAPPAGSGGRPSSPGVAHLSVDPVALRSLKLRARDLGVRRSSLLIALAEVALRTDGLAPRDDIRTVVVDCRRYLPAGAVVRGNFAAGQALRARWDDPADVDRAIAGALDQARPVLGLLAAAIPRRATPGSAPPGPFPVRPDYSVIGPLRGVNALPWSGAPSFVVAGRPGRPDAFGLTSTEIKGRLQLTVTYDRAGVDPGSVVAVLRTIEASLIGSGTLTRTPGEST
ncbi:MAG: hypothetical protein KJ548_08280 [Actinobacteria bacterium]|nr:hypothetical protein [Actinomycetota bacterium]MCG2798884.1 hypothetical protein [Cellulomonas sp.]